MKLRLITVSQKPPKWVADGCNEYLKRFPPQLKPNVIDIPLPKRNKNAEISRVVQQEAEAILTHIAPQDFVILLDVIGKQPDTPSLAKHLGEWLQDGRNVTLVIGGPDGVSNDIRKRADFCWSLSPLTFPHPLAKIVLCEQLYRAWSVLNNHPYHRI